MVRVSKVSDNGRVHCVLGGENRRVPWIEESQVSIPGRLIDGKLMENSGIPSNYLLQVFHLNQYWECWGLQRKRMKDRGPHPRKTVYRASSLALASTQRTKLEANVCEQGCDWLALSAPPPRGCIEHKSAKYLMTDGDSVDGVYV